MRDELAGRLLDSLLDWSTQEQAEWVPDLQQLASHKFDNYEGFSVGERFFESLARWLSQFPDQADRHRLIRFIREKLVFISRDEMNHAIECAYPDVIRRAQIRDVAEELSIPSYKVKTITESVEFRTLRRKTLYFGLSDGARLDRFRRSNPELSHEQFWLVPELGRQAQSGMAEKLAEAIAKLGLSQPPQFKQVVLVDDFYGSGTSLLRKEKNEWKGKLVRARNHIHDLQATEGDLEQLVAPDARVRLVIYVASAQAEEHVNGLLQDFEPGWDLLVVQRLPSTLRVTDEDIIRLCEWFFDPVLVDEHKGSAPLGYRDAALPLVLTHNTPNNSISILWADSVGREGGLERRAIFPRYERHHVERP